MCTYVRMYARMYVCMHACMRGCILYTHRHTCIPLHVYTYVCTYIHVYVRMHACMHVCNYVGLQAGRIGSMSVVCPHNTRELYSRDWRPVPKLHTRCLNQTKTHVQCHPIREGVHQWQAHAEAVEELCSGPEINVKALNPKPRNPQTLNRCMTLLKPLFLNPEPLQWRYTLNNVEALIIRSGFWGPLDYT